MSETKRSDPLEQVIADACLGLGSGEALATDLRGFLASRGVAPDDIEAIASAPPTLAVYRSLVRNGLARVIVRMLPRTRARMNAACAGGFDADVSCFLDEVGPRTHYLRDVPRELFAWAEPRWRAGARVPQYLVDLAAHELACFAVAAAEASTDSQAFGEIALDRAVAFTGSMHLLRYAFAVHELPADESNVDEPAHRDTHLLAYRDTDDAVRWLELTPLAAAIVERLVQGQPLGSAIAGACGDRGTTAAAVAEDVAKLLADLGDRGILLGARAVVRA